MKLSRRETLASMVAMAGAVGLGRDAAWAHEHGSGLHHAAKSKGMRFGSAVSAGNEQSGSYPQSAICQIAAARLRHAGRGK